MSEDNLTIGISRLESVEPTLPIEKLRQHRNTLKNTFKQFKKVSAQLAYRHLDFVRLLLSIVCCTLYIVQTVLPDGEFAYPEYCCGIAKFTTQPCALNNFSNGTIGWALRNAGCKHIERITKVPMGLNSQYLFSNITNADFHELTNNEICQQYPIDRCVENFCNCSIACGDTLYIGALKENCNDWNYLRLLFYEKPLWLYLLQIACSMLLMVYSITRALVYSYRGVRIHSIIEFTLFLDIMNGFISFASLTYVPCLKDLYIPLFLQCFTARVIITNILYSFDVTKISIKFLTPVFQKVIAVILGLTALLFAFTCVIHYFERILCEEEDNLNTLFDSIWFIIVTITTVGYGDLSPGTPLGKISVIFLILIILVFLPTTLTGILELINDSKQDYIFYRCYIPNRHVVLYIRRPDMTLICNFLNEFYSQEENKHLSTVVLTGEEVSPAVKILLKSPAWRNKVLVIIGSTLKERDLERVNLRLAKACFLLSDRITEDASMSDNETMLRASLIHSFAPNVELYVHIFLAENRMNVNFAKKVLCEGRLKQVLMANNCIYPGLSSLITILVHTTTSKDCADHSDDDKLYNYCSGNEIYAVRLKDSSLFNLLAGRTFLCASIFVQRTTEVLLFAVKPANKDNILLNPGRRHTLNDNDILYYIATEPEKTVYEDKQITPEDIKMNIVKIIRSTSEASVNQSGVFGPQQSTIEDVGFEILDTSCTPLYPPNALAMHPLTPTEESKGSLPIEPESPIHLRKFKLYSEHEKTVKTPLGNETKTLFKRQASRLLDNNKQKTKMIGLDKTGGEGETNQLTDIIIKNQDSTTTTISLNRGPTYFWVKETVLHQNKKPLNLCCLQAGWKILCHERDYTAVKKIQLPEEHNLERMLFLTGFKQPLIVCANEAGSQLYEFLLPLRAYHIPTKDLIPIVLLLPQVPDVAFLEAITWIPYIKFIVGRPECIDDLLIAGALNAVGVIICYGDAMPELKEEVHMSDASRISVARKMSHMFANTKFYVELTEIWSLNYLKLDNGRASYTNISAMDFIHAPYFVSSQAFAPSLLDTLLYQCMRKGYILDLVHLMLGLHQTPGSGYIGKVEVNESHLESFQTYGQFMLDLAVTHSQLALAIYRTTEDCSSDSTNSESDDTATTDPSSTEFFLKRRVEFLGIPYDKATLKRHRNEEKYHVLVNPPADTPLKPRDTVLVINSCTVEQYKLVRKSYCYANCPKTQIGLQAMFSTDTETESKTIPIVKKQSLTANKPPNKLLLKQPNRHSSVSLLGSIGLEKTNQSGNKYLKKTNSKKNLQQLQFTTAYKTGTDSLEIPDQVLGSFEGTESS